MNTKIARLVAEMTLDEKASLCTGNDFWTTKAIARLGIPAIFMTDGPHGLRKATEGALGGTVPATCFPTASALASSWNEELVNEVGTAIGHEAQANDVQVVLGPGVNMKRSPLAGRNFEYFSEDPYLSGTMAASFINGVQSTGTGTSLKHFAANNQEFERMASDSMVDERTLHETYLAAFELAVKAQPWSLMSAYNKINGTYASQNQELLITTLRDRWGYEGIVLSDWGAVYDIVQSIDSGLQLEMPGNASSPQKIIDAIEKGELDEETLDHSVIKLLEAILTVYENRRLEATYDKNAHHELARRAAGESVVLLKNKAHTLPLLPEKKPRIAVVGTFAIQPRYQGSGSSQVTPTHLASAYEELKAIYGESSLSYNDGYHSDGSTTKKLIQNALTDAKKADAIIVFAGLPSSYESEGFDRDSLDMPAGHNELIAALAKEHSNVIVVLMNGAAVSMPWISDVSALLEGWLGGQAGGQAIADILSGKTNPSGKLSETFPVRIENTPAYPDFPARGGVVTYREGILVGYRSYEARRIEPLFPFGFGLSYTSFEYGNLTLASDVINDDDTLSVTVSVKNTGKYAGYEVVQLYVSDHTIHAFHASKDLRRFSKVWLEPNEQKEIHFELDRRCFAYYDPRLHDWRVDPGEFIISVGNSSANASLSQALTMNVSYEHLPQLTRDSLLKDFAENPRGKTFYHLIVDQASKMISTDDVSSGTADFMERIISDMPLSKVGMLSGGIISDDLIDAIVIYCRHPHSLNPLHAFPLLKEAGKLIFGKLLNAKK